MFIFSIFLFSHYSLSSSIYYSPSNARLGLQCQWVNTSSSLIKHKAGHPFFFYHDFFWTISTVERKKTRPMTGHEDLMVGNRVVVTFQSEWPQHCELSLEYLGWDEGVNCCLCVCCLNVLTRVDFDLVTFWQVGTSCCWKRVNTVGKQ